MSTGAKRVATTLKVLGAVVVAAACVGTWILGGKPSFFDNSTAVPAPDAQMSAETAAQLARASAAQGVCYGWRLASRSTISRGSNLGAGVAVDSDPTRCAKWVEVQASVQWTDPSSEAPDSADVTIVGSGVAAPPASRLDRFGLTNAVFVDKPDWAICQAALALPLLAAEGGAVPPAPAGVASGAGAPGDLPGAGSDFWRDRWPYVIGGTLLLALAAVTIGIGWFERKHERVRAAAPGSRPPQAEPPPSADKT
jgi:hypothetical protein